MAVTFIKQLCECSLKDDLEARYDAVVVLLKATVFA